MKRVFSLRAYCSLRSLRFALGSRLVRRPLRTEEPVRSLLLTTAVRETVFDCSLRSLRFALGSRLVRRRLRTEERVRSLLLTTAARENATLHSFNLYLTYSNLQ